MSWIPPRGLAAETPVAVTAVASRPWLSPAGSICDASRMSIRMRDAMARTLGELRHEPTEKRIRAAIAGQPVVDSRRALLVWEPRRITPSYAVPLADVGGELSPAEAGVPPRAASAGPPMLHPGIPFGIRDTDGQALDITAAGESRAGAAFRPADLDLHDHVILDFHGFDAWYEEDEPVFSHPRDPFHRVDIRRSSRRVRVELDGVILAESDRPALLFETNLPMRFYLPSEDARAPMRASAKRTYCPYKGEASYWSFDVNGRAREDLAWTYETPLPDCGAVTGLVAFFDELVDVVVDGESRARPQTEWSREIRDETEVSAS